MFDIASFNNQMQRVEDTMRLLPTAKLIDRTDGMYMYGIVLPESYRDAGSPPGGWPFTVIYSAAVDKPAILVR